MLYGYSCTGLIAYCCLFVRPSFDDRSLRAGDFVRERQQWKYILERARRLTVRDTRRFSSVFDLLLSRQFVHRPTLLPVTSDDIRREYDLFTIRISVIRTRHLPSVGVRASVTVPGKAGYSSDTDSRVRRELFCFCRCSRVYGSSWCFTTVVSVHLFDRSESCFVRQTSGPRVNV